jgi:hypothetical protein
MNSHLLLSTTPSPSKPLQRVISIHHVRRHCRPRLFGVLTSTCIPVFSIALNRGTFEEEENDPFTPNLGFVSFGGLAPVPVTKTSATAPVQGYNVQSFDPSNATTATDFFYTIDVQGLSFAGASSKALGNTFSSNVIVDTGNYPTSVYMLHH